jgi:hypothetical protein
LTYSGNFTFIKLSAIKLQGFGNAEAEAPQKKEKKKKGILLRMLSCKNMILTVLSVSQLNQLYYVICGWIRYGIEICILFEWISPLAIGSVEKLMSLQKACVLDQSYTQKKLVNFLCDSGKCSYFL